MVPITFGSMTMPTSIPRALRTSGDTGIGMLQQLNSTWSASEVGPTGAGQGATTLTADVAADYQGIRANMPNKKGNLINRIASWLVDRKLDNAV